MEYYVAFHGEYRMGILAPDQDYGVLERRRSFRYGLYHDYLGTRKP